MFIAGSIQSLRWFPYSENNEKIKQKRASPTAFIFNFSTETTLTLRCLYVNVNRDVRYWLRIYIQLLPNPCNREFEINILNSKRRIFQVIQQYV
jgi:hypothetical protein